MAIDFIYLMIITIAVLSLSIKISEMIIRTLLKRLFKSGI